MGNQNTLEEIRRVLRKSRREPFKFIEFIACILDMNKEGETASYPKIVRRLWPEQWQQAEDKTAFEITKWDLLCKRRREINERLFYSHLCFHFFIELSQEKAFHIITDYKKIYYKRLEELEQNLAKGTAKANIEKIKAQITELTDRFRELEKGEGTGPADAEDSMGRASPAVPGEDRKKLQPARWKWAAAGTAAVLIILTIAIVITNITYSPSLPPEVLEFSGNPSIAVLPFKDMSDDPNDKYFIEGIAEEIVTVLSVIPKILLIDTTSSTIYRDKQVDIQQIGKELNVQYVLKGSVRKVGGKLKILIQLTDTATGNLLWAERYNIGLKDFLSLQDKITMDVLEALQIKLTEGDQARLWKKGTKNLEAYLKVLQARSYLPMGSLGDIMHVRQLAEQVIDLDPEYGMGYILLAKSYMREYIIRIGDKSQTLEQALQLAQKAIALDDSNGAAWSLLGLIYYFERKPKKAISAAEHAVALNPNSAQFLSVLGVALGFSGWPEKALPYIQKAMLINPTDNITLNICGSLYNLMGKYEDAIRVLKKLNKAKLDYVPGLIDLCFSYMALGREDEARETLAEALRINPEITLEKEKRRAIRGCPDPAYRKFYIESLQKAGLK